MVTVCLAGATGKVGREIVKALGQRDDMRLVACIGSTTAGTRLPAVLGIDCPDLLISRTLDDAVKTAPFDVLVDYTAPAGVFQRVSDAVRRRVHCVIGTSGLSTEQYGEIAALAEAHRVGVFAAGNFSLTAALMARFAELAARHVPHWEVVDYAPDSKKDAPSGTTREIAHLLRQVGRARHAVAPAEVHGSPESRGATIEGTQVHSIRVPGFYSSSEVIFGLPGERLSLRHDSISAAPYVAGTLLAIEKVGGFEGLVRGMHHMLDLSP